MKCNRCGKEIDELEIFCDECKKELKKVSSKNEVKELEELIENQKKLTELENTKELIDLESLVQEEIKEQVEEKDQILDSTKEKHIEEKEKSVEEVKKESKKQKKKMNKRKKIIISVILIVIVIALIILFVFLNNNKEEEKEIVIDYEDVIKKYGNSITGVVEDYMSDNEDIPTWQYVIEKVDYDEYEVECDNHNIYSDGSIYLSECKVNNKKTKYTYGEEIEEVKEGKKINVYRYGNDGAYSDIQYEDFVLVGTVTCKTEFCEYINAYDKYVIIKEEGNYYLYDYVNDLLNFGPFIINSENEYENVLVNNNDLYGIYYKDDNQNNIYNIKTGKILKNIKGSLTYDEMYFNPSIMYKYNYAVLYNGGKYDFVNLKTGNVSYSIKGNLDTFTEDSNKKIVYITVYNDDYTKIKVYNSNGKLLFGGKEYSKFEVGDNCLLVATETNFKVYDKNLKLKTTSKDYDEIIGLNKDFVVAIKDNDLILLDINAKELTTFEDGWDSENYTFHSMLSGWYTENNKNGIYLVIENNLIPYGTLGSGMEYYYIPSTKESGIIETEGVGGYAKPVLYLYPEEKTNITVTFEDTSLLTTTYPKFKNKWSVTAYPNGDLYDKQGNYYYALYWEEDRNHYIDFSEGFYVTSDNAIDFLEKKLEIIGLNDKERNEFIMYWLPILEKNKKSLVYFELTEERDYYNKLIINPKPDSILRVAIHVKKVNKKTSIKKQKLTSFKRSGYTAVEWGGVIY